MKTKPAQAIKRLKTAVHLTPSGKALVLSMGFVLLAAVIIPALGVFSCLAAMLICSVIFGAMFKPRNSIHTTMPSQTTVGSQAFVQYSIENTSSSHSFCLTLNLTDLPRGWRHAGGPVMIQHLKPKSIETVQVTLLPTRRGLFTLPCPACYSSFPFHLISFNVAKGPTSQITVLPAYDAIQIDPPVHALSSFHAGSGYAPSPSHLPEYAGNRPFLSGDSLRHIDSRAWARLAEPVVKEYHNDVRCHCALYLKDNRKAVSRQDWDPEFEAMVSLCASVAHSFGHNTVVDYLLVDTTIHDLRSISADTRFGALLEILAGLVPETQRENNIHELESCLNQVSSVYALYLGGHRAIDSERKYIEERGIELHTLHVTETPDLVSWTASRVASHLEIDAHAILARQISAL